MKKIRLLLGVFSVAIFCGCSIDKSKYESVNLADAGLGTIVGVTEPDANEVKYFKALAKYCNFSDGIKQAIGGKKDEFAFATNDSKEMVTFFKIKCRKPELEDGQVVTIYFRLVRKNGRVAKTEIDFIE
jgi:hypothetical protein